jgi:hypothetical protein
VGLAEIEPASTVSVTGMIAALPAVEVVGVTVTVPL